MFEKFGEFNSYYEINRAAAAQLAEGDTEAIILLAKENGIDPEDAQDYIRGYMPALCTERMAAIGKLELEARELKLEGLLLDWKGYIVECCMDSEGLCIAVRQKGMSLATCLSALLKYSFETKKQVPDAVVKGADLRTPLYIGVPGRADAKRIIKEYYTK